MTTLVESRETLLVSALAKGDAHRSISTGTSIGLQCDYLRPDPEFCSRCREPRQGLLRIRVFLKPYTMLIGKPAYDLQFPTGVGVFFPPLEVEQAGKEMLLSNFGYQIIMKRFDN